MFGMKKNRSVFISGGGPAGLAAALLFDQLGWDEVVLAERRASPSDFEKNKSFNYLVDKRGQRLLDRIGLLDRLPEKGVATQEFVATTVSPDGKAKTEKVPIIDPNRPFAYWTTRRALLAMLFEGVEQKASARTQVLYGHSVDTIQRDAGGKVEIAISDQSGAVKAFSPDLVLACDGLNSVIRSSLSSQPDVPDGYFDMIEGDSISAGLRYKVLNLPARFETANGEVKLHDNSMSYIIPSVHKDQSKACTLFAFPVVDPSHPRSVNLIRETDHTLWQIHDSEELFEFLEESFPQLKIRELVPEEEAKDFVTLEAGAFPQPQYAKNLHTSIGPEHSPTEFVLIGDAAHAFPPDLGLGVNSALEDLDVLARHFEAHDNIGDAARSYAKERWPEARDLAWVVEKFFPEQYNHRPWKLKIWALGFIVRKLLNNVAPSLFDKPAFFLSQDPDMSFGEMKKRKLRTDFRVRALGIGIVALLAGLVVAT